MKHAKQENKDKEAKAQKITDLSHGAAELYWCIFRKLSGKTAFPFFLMQQDHKGSLFRADLLCLSMFLFIVLLLGVFDLLLFPDGTTIGPLTVAQTAAALFSALLSEFTE